MLVLEVEGGFIVRCVSRADRDIDLLEFADDSYHERMIHATEARGEGERRESPSPVAPTGYEDLLRALGRRIDERHGSRVVIAEKRDSIIIAGDSSAEGEREPFNLMFGEQDITLILDEAFRMRNRDERSGSGG